MASVNMAAPMLHKTTECTHSSDQPAPRRITPRAASINHVVGKICATYQKAAGIESGIALSILSEADDTPVRALAKSLAECWGRAGSMCLKLWERNVQETRQATV